MDYDEKVTLDDLNKLDKPYQDAKSDLDRDPPDGKYTACIESAKLQKTPKGIAFLFYTLVISSGTQKGRKLYKRSYITKDSMDFFKSDLKICGIVLENLTHLPERRVELTGVELSVYKREQSDSDGYDLFFNKKLS